jgi:hypothetical protein
MDMRKGDVRFARMLLKIATSEEETACTLGDLGEGSCHQQEELPLLEV